ncbi:MAG: MFS transporter [Roseburia sp.]|nr:MFS transporter [Roseburia sp.]
MSKTNVNQNENDGVSYRRAKTWQIILCSFNAGIGTSFYILLGLASYIANAGYGIATAVVGIILTATRIFDGVTDPIIAILIDKTNTRFGKIRILMGIGWAIEALAVYIMYCWASGKGFGILTFVILYLLYIIGYTLCNVTGQIIAPVLTNDPKQRPMVGVWNTVFNYLIPMILNIALTVILLPRFGNEYNLGMLAAACKVCLSVSALSYVMCCIGVFAFDKPENFNGISAASRQKPVKFKDMWALLKSNKALQTYIVAAASDKIASQTASQTIITTMLFGIIIGDMQLGTILSVIGMLPSIIFAVIGGKYAGKHGNRESMVTWTYVAMTVAAVTVVLFIFIDPTLIATAVPAMVGYVILTLLLNGSKMCITMSSNAMMADIIDYELDRSGKYLPAAVTATYSFVDKLVSSLSALIATGAVALIGYTNTMPQPTDPSTPQIFWLTMSLYFGLPIIGWVCTLCAMRYSPLSKEKMVEVQRSISEKKKLARAEFLNDYK